MEDTTRTAREMWTRFEPVHAVTYFSAEARSAFQAAGLRGFWRGYFAGRAAPLGTAGPAVVGASFFSFAPAMVQRAVPGVWELITPEEALRARLAGAADALRRLRGSGPRSPRNCRPCSPRSRGRAPRSFLIPARSACRSRPADRPHAESCTPGRLGPGRLRLGLRGRGRRRLLPHLLTAP